MGGWSGGVYTRFRNWATDKANSVNPQATLFDQEDDGFAAGLNNCVTKDGLNKPSSPMDWNGQNLIGVNLFTAANVNVTGATVPANGCYLSAANTLSFSSAATLRATLDSVGRWAFVAPTAGTAFTVNGFANSDTMLIQSSATSGQAFGLRVQAGSTSADYSFLVNDKSNATNYLKVRGDGLTQAIDQGSTLQDLGWRDAPQNLQNANYTFVLADRGKDVHHSSGVAHTWTIPDNSVTAFPVGTVIILTNSGAAAVTIGIPATDALVWVPSGLTTARTLTGFGQAQLLKVAATTWFLTGANVT